MKAFKVVTKTDEVYIPWKLLQGDFSDCSVTESFEEHTGRDADEIVSFDLEDIKELPGEDISMKDIIDEIKSWPRSRYLQLCEKWCENDDYFNDHIEQIAYDELSRRYGL